MQRRDFITTTGGALAGSILACAVPGAGRMNGSGGGGTAPARHATLDVAAFRAARRFADTRFGRIAYVERGSGDAALFIHGLPLNGYQWRGALERLSPHRRCLAPDLMGLGYSEIPAGQALDPAAQAEMLAAFLDEVGAGPVDIIASDSGGAVAQLFLVRYPERVRTLLLTNCDVHEDSPPPALIPVIEASRAGRFVDDVLVPQLRDKRASLAATGLAGCCYTRPRDLSAEAIDYYLTPLASSPLRTAQLHGYCVALADNPLVPIEPELRRSQVPVRVVWGTGDSIFDPAGPAWLDRTFPRSRGYRLIEGANLFWPEEMPEVVAEEAKALWEV